MKKNKSPLVHVNYKKLCTPSHSRNEREPYTYYVLHRNGKSMHMIEAGQEFELLSMEKQIQIIILEIGVIPLCPSCLESTNHCTSKFHSIISKMNDTRECGALFGLKKKSTEDLLVDKFKKIGKPYKFTNKSVENMQDNILIIYDMIKKINDVDSSTINGKKLLETEIRRLKTINSISQIYDTNNWQSFCRDLDILNQDINGRNNILLFQKKLSGICLFLENVLKYNTPITPIRWIQKSLSMLKSNARPKTFKGIDIFWSIFQQTMQFYIHVDPFSNYSLFDISFQKSLAAFTSGLKYESDVKTLSEISDNVKIALTSFDMGVEKMSEILQYIEEREAPIEMSPLIAGNTNEPENSEPSKITEVQVIPTQTDVSEIKLIKKEKIEQKSREYPSIDKSVDYSKVKIKREAFYDDNGEPTDWEPNHYNRKLPKYHPHYYSGNNGKYDSNHQLYDDFDNTEIDDYKSDKFKLDNFKLDDSKHVDHDLNDFKKDEFEKDEFKKDDFKKDDFKKDYFENDDFENKEIKNDKLQKEMYKNHRKKVDDASGIYLSTPNSYVKLLDMRLRLEREIVSISLSKLSKTELAQKISILLDYIQNSDVIDNIKIPIREKRKILDRIEMFRKSRSLIFQYIEISQDLGTIASRIDMLLYTKINDVPKLWMYKQLNDAKENVRSLIKQNKLDQIKFITHQWIPLQTIIKIYTQKKKLNSNAIEKCEVYCKDIISSNTNIDNMLIKLDNLIKLAITDLELN